MTMLAAGPIPAVHPDWTPAEVKSALMMTANPGKDLAGDPSNPDIDGSGTVDLTEAALAGLIMDENYDNMLAANPATGGDPATLNLPSMRSSDCNGTCSWTRTVCNALDAESSWTIVEPTPAGYELFVPGSNGFNLLPHGMLQDTGFEDGETANSSCKTFEVSVQVNDMALVTAGEWIFDEITLESASSPDLTMTVAFLPTGIAPP